MKKFVSIALFFSWLMAQEDVITLPSGARLDLPHTANIRVDTIMVQSGATFAAESPRDFSTAIATGDGTIITGQPLVSSVSSSTSDGAYNAGDTLLITVTFSENVTVTGTPQLTMETGSTDDAILNYGSGSGTTTLVFRYIVASGHTSADLAYRSTTALALPDTTVKIRDNLVNDGVLTLPVPGAENSLNANKALVIDTEAPTTGTVSDGSGSDVTYSGSSTSVTANWTGFSDALSGIAGYEIAVGTTSGATNVLSWTSAGNVTTYTKSDLSLTHATRYYVSTRAQDAAGNYSSAATANGVIIDVVAPSSTVSIDSTTYNAAEWDAATEISGTAADTNSGLSLVETSIQRSTDSYYWTGSDWSATEQWLSLTGTSTWNYAISSAYLTDGATYTVRSRGTDAADNMQTSYGSDSFIYDISEPNTALFIANNYYNPTGWTANQPIQGTAADDYSGITKVEVLIKRAADNKYWTSSGWTADSTWLTATGTATWQYTISADSLTNTETYTVRSRATDGSTNLETSYSSDSFVFDSTLPVSVINIERDYYNNANWSDVSSISGTTSDGTSGMSTVEITIQRNSDLGYWNGLQWELSQNWLSPSSGLASWTYYYTNLDDGITYIVKSRATDIAGNVQTSLGSDSFIYDVTAPVAGTVADGLTSTDQEWSSDLTTMSAIWTGFSDALSGLGSYEYSIGSEAGGTQVVNWTNVAMDTSMIDSSLTLLSGYQYFVNIRAIDQAENSSSSAISNGVNTDNIPPEVTAAYDGSATVDQEFQQDSASMIVGWAATDSRELSYYSASLGTDTALVDIVAWTAVGSGSNYTFTGLSLQEGVSYYANVKAIDQAGNESAVYTTDGIIIDRTGPAVGTVNDGNSGDIDWVSNNFLVTGNINDFSDALSGIAEYQYSLGITPGGTQSQPWTSNALDTAIIMLEFLVADVTYYLNVRAIDSVGNIGPYAASDGFGVDQTDPVAGNVYDGVTGETEIEWTNNTRSVPAYWAGFTDTYSGIEYYDYAIGTPTSDIGVIGWTAVDTNLTVLHDNLALVNGVLYHTSVRATDGVGNVSLIARSNGFTIDTDDAVITSIIEGDQVADWDYQATDTSIILAWIGTDAASGVARYDYAVGTHPDSTNIISWTSAGLATNATVTGLSLTEGTVTYYSSVRVTDAAGNLSQKYSGDGIIVDLTAPLAGTIIDGLTTDLIYTGSSSVLSTSWQGFMDSISGIDYYEYAIGSAAASTDIAPWTNITLDSAVTTTALNLGHANTYYHSVRAVDLVNNVSLVVTSNGITVDLSAPETGIVIDGLNSDQYWTNNTAALDLSWSGFQDLTSGIANYQLAIGTVAGSNNILPWIDLDTATASTQTGLSLVNGGTYFGSIKAVDAAGNVAAAVSSNGITVDADDPVITSLFEADLTIDWDYQATDTSIILAWTGTDAGSGVANYEYALGTYPDSTNIISWTSAGLSTNTTVTGLSLTEGTVTYYSSVRVTDAAGNLSQKYYGDGIIVDLTAPLAGTIIDGLTTELSYTGSNSVLSTSWQGFSDAISGIDFYEYAIGSAAGGADISDWIIIALDSAVTTTALNLSHANTYYQSVRALDLVSNVSQVVTSNGITVDLSAPETGIVVDGLTSDLYWTNSTNSLDLSWSGFQDTTSGIENYQLSIGSVAGSNNVLPWVDLDTVTATTQTGLSLANGGTYFGNIKAIDAVSNVAATISSNGITVDADDPVITSLFEANLLTDWDYQGSDSSFIIVWSGSDDASGIIYYEYALGTESGAADVVDWTLAELNTSIIIDSLELEEERETYYGSVRATDLAGNTSDAFSGDGVEVDISPPQTGSVIDGTNDDLVFTGEDTTLTATWHGFSDAISGLQYYEYAIGVSPGSDDVLSWVNNGLDTTLSIGELELDHATVYYQSVRAVDLVNNVSATAASDGITTDHSSPEAGVINDGAGADETWLTTNDRLYLNWHGFQDTTSGIQYYEYAIGTVPGQSNVVPWANVAMDTAAVDSELVLNHGVTYYGSVRVTDNVGNVSNPYSSNGITVDLFNPTVDIPVDGVLSGGDLDYQAVADSLVVYWAPTVEAELDYYEYSFSTTIGAEDIVPWTVTTDTMAVIDSLDLAHAQIYYSNLRAFDLAGNPSFVSSSDGITVDLYQPITGTIIDGLSEDEAYTGSLNTLVVTWTDFSDTVSGIQYFEYGVGTTSGSLDIRNWTDIGPVTTINAGALSLVDETSYYVSVKATDGVGHVSAVATTNGVIADHTGPAGTTVNDGDSTDIDRQNDLSSFSGNWLSFTDEFSGLARHEVALYDVTGAAFIETWTDAGLDTVITFNGLDLVDGNTYEIRVRGVDAVGNTGTIVQSDGVLIDLSAPAVPINLIGWFTTGRIFLEWTGNTETDLGYYSIYGGTENNPTDLLLTTTVDTAEAFMPGYDDGTKYYLRITATDIPGNESDYTDEEIGIPQETAITSISPDTSIVYAANQNQLTIQLSQPVTDIGTVSSSSIGYPEGMQISLTYSPTDTTILIQFDEPFASLDTIDLVLSGMVDWSNNGTTDKYLTLHTYLLADYNSDNLINVIDLTDFATAWSANTLSFELGPVSGTVPHLIPVPNGKFDLRDVMAFTRMWHWYNQTPILSGGGLLASGNDIGPLLNIAQQDRSLVLSLPQGAAAGQVLVHYPPVSKQFSTITDVTSEKQIYLSVRNQEAGQLLVEWADLGSENMAEVVLVAQSLDRNNTNVTITYTIFDDNKEIISKGTQTVVLKAIPDSYALHNNFPNPFNPVTNIFYDLPESGHVRMVIYDLLGREVTTLINETMESGYYATQWNGRNQYGQPVSAGIYFYHLQTGAYSKAQKMLLVK